MINPRITLAVVDDNPTDRLLFEFYMRDWLKNVSITFFNAPPGDLRELLQFDAIVLDQNLAGITGLEVTEKLRSIPNVEGWRVPVVILTGAKPSDFGETLLSDPEDQFGRRLNDPKELTSVPMGEFDQRSVLHSADYLAWKHPERTGIHFSYGQHGVLRTLVRWVARVKSARHDGFSEALKLIRAGKLTGYSYHPEERDATGPDSEGAMGTPANPGSDL